MGRSCVALAEWPTGSCDLDFIYVTSYIRKYENRLANDARGRRRGRGAAQGALQPASPADPLSADRRQAFGRRACRFSRHPRFHRVAALGPAPQGWAGRGAAGWPDHLVLDQQRAGPRAARDAVPRLLRSGLALRAELA